VSIDLFSSDVRGSALTSYGWWLSDFTSPEMRQVVCIGTLREVRDIPGFPSYQATESGEIVSSKYGDLRTLRPHDDGHYLRVSLRRDGKTITRTVHSLIALAYHGAPQAGKEVRHWDGDRLNNKPENLSYSPHSENQLDQLRHGTHFEAMRTHCDNGHEFVENNIMWQKNRKSGRPYRRCKECHRIAIAKWRAARKSKQAITPESQC
jgi:hypothetical protein